MAVPVAAVAAGIGAVGKAIGAIGGYRAGKARRKALVFAARNARREAGVQASLAMEESDRVGARAATLAAASGGGGLEGSALAVIDDLARQGMYRARQTVRDGIAKSNALLTDADVAKQQAQLDLTTGMMDAGMTFLGGIAGEAQRRRGAGERVPGWIGWAG